MGLSLGEFIGGAAGLPAGPIGIKFGSKIGGKAQGSLFGGKYDHESAIMSGIPFIGEGYAAQDAQRFEAAMAERKMEFEDQQASYMRNFQEKMANSAHQREMQDLKEAGLNPILAANTGAATPTGAMGSGAMAVGKVAKGSAKLADMMLAKYKKEREAADAIINRNNSAAALSRSQEKVAKSQSKYVDSQNEGQKIVNRLTGYQEPNAKAQYDFDKKYAPVIKRMDAVNKGLNQILNNINSAKGVLIPKLNLR